MATVPIATMPESRVILINSTSPNPIRHNAAITAHSKLQTPITAGSNAIKASNFASFAAPSMGFITL